MAATQIELPEPEVKEIDMGPAETEFAFDVCKKGVMSLYRNERRTFAEVAKYVKKEMDGKFGGAWHVFTGRHFGAWVTHEVQHMIYFHIGQAAFLIFRHG